MGHRTQLGHLLKTGEVVRAAAQEAGPLVVSGAQLRQAHQRSGRCQCHQQPPRPGPRPPGTHTPLSTPGAHLSHSKVHREQQQAHLQRTGAQPQWGGVRAGQGWAGPRGAEQTGVGGTARGCQSRLRPPGGTDGAGVGGAAQGWSQGLWAVVPELDREGPRCGGRSHAGQGQAGRGSGALSGPGLGHEGSVGGEVRACAVWAGQPEGAEPGWTGSCGGGSGWGGRWPQRAGSGWLCGEAWGWSQGLWGRCQSRGGRGQAGWGGATRGRDWPGVGGAGKGWSQDLWGVVSAQGGVRLGGAVGGIRARPWPRGSGVGWNREGWQDLPR